MPTPRVIVTHRWYLDVPEEAIDEDFDTIANTGVSMMERHMVLLNPKIKDSLLSEWKLMWLEGDKEVFPEDPTADEVNEALRKRREEAERRAEMLRRAEWDAAHGPVTTQDMEEYGRGFGEIEAVGDDDVEVVDE